MSTKFFRDEEANGSAGIVGSTQVHFTTSESSAQLLRPLEYSQTEQKNQYKCGLVACMAGIAAGCVFAYTSPVLQERENELTHLEQSWIAAILHIGSFTGGCSGGLLNVLMGKRITLMVIMLPFLLGNLCLISAANVETMYLGRLLDGFAVGVICVTTPTYLAEISEPSIRGRLGACFNLSGCIGALLANVAGIWLSWRWMGVFLCIFPIVTFVGMLTIGRESPTDCLVKSLRAEADGNKHRAEAKHAQAKNSLLWLRGDRHDCTRELSEIEDSVLRARSSKSIRPTNVIRDAGFYKPLGIGLGLMMFQQLSGITAVVCFTNKIFESAGSSVPGYVSTVVVLTTQVVIGVVAAGVVDKWGRRPLLLASGTVESLSLASLGLFFYLQEKHNGLAENLGFLPVTSMVVYIIAFSLGFGPLPWLMMGELFPDKTRAAATSLVTASCGFGAFVVTITFLDLIENLASYGTFWLFAVGSGLSVPFVWLAVPETKGKTLEDIQKGFVAS